MAKKKIDISKLGTGPTKKVVKKSQPTEKAIAAIHRGKPVRTSIDIDRDTHVKLKIRSAESGISMKELIIQFIHQGLEA